MANITVKIGTLEEITLAITKGGSPLSLIGATLTLKFKRHRSETSAIITKNDVDFSGDRANGIIIFELTVSDTSLPNSLIGDLKIDFGSGDVKKTEDITLLIKESIT